MLISGCVCVLAVLLSVLNAYALGIGRVKGRTWILGAFLIANFLPQEGLVYPLYDLAKEFGLYDSRLAVIIIFTVIQAAFGTYLLSSVLSTFPRELLEAARMDGAGRARILWRVVVPVSRPTLGVLLVFFFIWTWNEFFLPLVFLVSNAEPDRARRARHAAGPAHHEPADHQRRGAARGAPHRHLLPHLPADADPRRHRRRRQVARVFEHGRH